MIILCFFQSAIIHLLLVLFVCLFFFCSWMKARKHGFERVREGNSRLLCEAQGAEKHRCHGSMNWRAACDRRHSHESYYYFLFCFVLLRLSSVVWSLRRLPSHRLGRSISVIRLTRWTQRSCCLSLFRLGFHVVFFCVFFCTFFFLSLLSWKVEAGRKVDFMDDIFAKYAVLDKVSDSVVDRARVPQ